MTKSETILEERAIECAVAYIEENLNQKLRLDDIAKHTGYSKYHLNRRFADIVGCTIYKYLRERRLDLAAAKLATTDKPIIDIALDAGYGSQQAFTLAFRQEYHLAPQQYRLRQIHVSRRPAYGITVMHFSIFKHYQRRLAA